MSESMWYEDPAQIAEWLREPHEDVVGALVEDGSIATSIAETLDRLSASPVGELSEDAFVVLVQWPKHTASDREAVLELQRRGLMELRALAQHSGIVPGEWARTEAGDRLRARLIAAALPAGETREWRRWRDLALSLARAVPHDHSAAIEGRPTISHCYRCRLDATVASLTSGETRDGARECSACGGAGWDVETQAGCCGQPLRSGECCGEAVPVQEQVECERCGGSGRNPSGESAEPDEDLRQTIIDVVFSRRLRDDNSVPLGVDDAEEIADDILGELGQPASAVPVGGDELSSEHLAALIGFVEHSAPMHKALWQDVLVALEAVAAARLSSTTKEQPGV